MTLASTRRTDIPLRLSLRVVSGVTLASARRTDIPLRLSLRVMTGSIPATIRRIAFCFLSLCFGWPQAHLKSTGHTEIQPTISTHTTSASTQYNIMGCPTHQHPITAHHTDPVSAAHHPNAPNQRAKPINAITTTDTNQPNHQPTRPRAPQCYLNYIPSLNTIR